MPLKSQAQRAWMHIHHPKMADRWEKHTPKGKLPKHVREGEGKTCPSCELGYHERCRDEWCDCCHGGKREALPRMTEVFNADELPDPEEEGEEYIKTAPIHAMRMDEPFEVETEEGTMSGKEGDWLAKGPEGEMWPIDDEIFQSTHEPTGKDISEPIVNILYHHVGEEGESESAPEVVQRLSDFYDDEHDGPTDRHWDTGSPPMESVFREAGNRPPGSKPFNPSEFMKLGQVGRQLRQQSDAMAGTGQTGNVYSTPQGQLLWYPERGQPGEPPRQADITKGVWAPMTGSKNTGATNTSKPTAPGAGTMGGGTM